jgi:hypothetical protein
MAYGDLDTRCLGFEGFTPGVGFDGIPVAGHWSLPADPVIQGAVLHLMPIAGQNWWEGYRPRAMKIHVTTSPNAGGGYVKSTEEGLFAKHLADILSSYYDGATEILFNWGDGTYDFLYIFFYVFYEAFTITRIELDPLPVLNIPKGFWTKEIKCREVV